MPITNSALTTDNDLIYNKLIMQDILTSQTLWENFDPNAEQLDIDVIKTTATGNVTTKHVYFTGRKGPYGPTRVFANVCYKGSAKGKPSILVVGSFSQPIDLEQLHDLANRGFVAMAIDFVGRRDKGLFTLYPLAIDYCNDVVAPSMFEITDTARETKIFEYATNVCRAVTYLLQAEKVSNVSLLTVGKGVYVGIVVLGVDSRVEKGAILFGNLFRNYPDPTNTEKIGMDDDDDLSRHIAYDVKRQIWTLGLAPQTYALQIKAPLYIVTSANSEHVDASVTSKMFYRVNNQCMLLILPTCMDYLTKKYSDGVIRWLKNGGAMNKTEIKSFFDEHGDYCLKVVTQYPLNNTSVWYCTNAEGHSKHWAKANLVQGDGCYCAKIDLYEKVCNFAAFALFDDKVPTSTVLFEEKVTAVNVKKANNIIFSGNTNQALIPVSRDGKWWNVDLEPKLAKGHLNIVGSQGKALATFAISDKSIRINPSFTVGFDVCSNVKQKLSIVAVCKFGEQNEEYSQSTMIAGTGKWERVTFDKTNFHRTIDSKPLTVNDSVDVIVIYAEDEFIVNNIFLV